MQKRFLEMSGVGAQSLLELLDANRADIRDAVRNFRSFTAGGELHTILGRPEFYEYRVGEYRLRDWVTRLARHEDPGDVRCEPCEQPER